MASFDKERERDARSRGGRTRQNRPDRTRVQLSKKITFALRHGAHELGLRVRPDGYVRLDELLGNPRFRRVSRQEVEDVVSLDEKGRMSIISDDTDGGGGLLIRANQGHSVKGLVDEEQLLTKIERPQDVPVCIHGTSLVNWRSIRESGLRCMNRTHIHFAAGLPGEKGVVSGMRRSSQVLIYVDVEAAMSGGVTFFRSSNNVILTSGIKGTLSASFFSHVEGVSDFTRTTVHRSSEAVAEPQHGAHAPAPRRTHASTANSDWAGAMAKGTAKTTTEATSPTTQALDRPLQDMSVVPVSGSNSSEVSKSDEDAARACEDDKKGDHTVAAGEHCPGSHKNTC